MYVLFYFMNDTQRYILGKLFILAIFVFVSLESILERCLTNILTVGILKGVNH